MDPAFVDTKETLRRDHGKAPDLIAARHVLWKNILNSEVTVRQRILDDHIEAGYAGLYTYVHDAGDDFAQLVTTLNNDQFHMYAKLLTTTQQMISDTSKEQDFDADDFYDGLEIETSGLKNEY